MTPLDLLAKTPYVLLVTFRKDGTAVSTPVWAVLVGNELQVWTNPSAGKVKRIRRSGRVQVAPCDRRGGNPGRLIDGSARILHDGETSALLDALRGKYGFQAWMTQLPAKFAKLVGKAGPPVGGIGITLDS